MAALSIWRLRLAAAPNLWQRTRSLFMRWVLSFFIAGARQAKDKDGTVAAATPQRVRQAEASLVDRMVRITSLASVRANWVGKVLTRFQPLG
ncbi:MAG: hypothetical protein DME56_08035 [Verrucomicrobia bacterium]|nr:MAG: hypothetical protein DMF00_09815 [Verrucomicrobiota bacterium]PYK20211.1 MAG: hypothetical protein DME56_08035 [Verrucomicrobiota bacterium]